MPAHRSEIVFLVIGLLAGTATSATARTWHVERDGSGDFVVIQDAVDAASPGDTIEIGPGRFDEWEALPGYPEAPVYVLVEKDLTFQGAGMGQTLIGPDDVNDHPPEQYYTMGFRIWGNGIHCAIRDLTIENLRWRGLDMNRGRLEIDRCEFRGCIESGLFGLFSSGGWIRDSSFHDIGTWGRTQGIGVNFFTPSVGVEVARCSFTNINGGGLGAWWSGCQDIDVVNCQFEHGIIGASFIDGASGSIKQCTFNDFSNYGIALDGCGAVVVEDNTITQIGDFASVGIMVAYTADSLTMRRNIVVSDTWVLNIFARIQSGEIRDNHFIREEENSWWVFTEDYFPLPEPLIINLEHNYWGTTDTALLDQWIYDGNDNEDVDLFVDYLPLADGPVQTESTTWGAVKSLFR
jgi:hypothetical protein